MDHASLEGKVAIVTGGAMGMGEATTRLFAEAGAKVLLADRNEDVGRQVASDIKAGGGTVEFHAVDVSGSDGAKAMVEAAVSTFGRLDVAVNNAAVTPDTHQVHELDEDEFDNIIAINLRGVALCMKYEIGQMIKQGDPGAIVNIASINGLRPQFNSIAYSASKHAVIGMTKVAALENASRGIRVNGVAPGAIDTPMLRGAVERTGGSADDSAGFLSLFNRLGRPEEVAQASLWLASDLSSFVTGETLAVDAGYSNS
ncbi:MAG: glucose 1-dehydrogenase [Gammaproteobacteria bacterium]|jgi:NAD(P)-dependent dehydrogenase (short-subunit alcohol dehydrogenase family)|nr:glucose 1-dehydrogenase [Gammaproteobacteria bacterium]MBT4491709.1 glucose 1-dehydrogenase [Gammaproteobacteria bacterium]